MQQSSQEEVAKGRGPARAEADRGTGQGTSGVKRFLGFFQESGQQEAEKRSTTPNDGRVRRNTLANLSRSSRSAQFSQSVGQEEKRDGSHTRSGRGGHGSGRGNRMSPARDARGSRTSPGRMGTASRPVPRNMSRPFYHDHFCSSSGISAPPIGGRREFVSAGGMSGTEKTGSSQFLPGHHRRRGTRYRHAAAASAAPWVGTATASRHGRTTVEGSSRGSSKARHHSNKGRQ